jgi:hypothetical protein
MVEPVIPSALTNSNVKLPLSVKVQVQAFTSVSQPWQGVNAVLVIVTLGWSKLMLAVTAPEVGEVEL